MRTAGIEANVFSYGSVIHACAKAGEAERAEAWLAEMLRCGVKANAVTCNTVINAWAKAGRLDRAEEWVSRLGNMGVKSDVITYNTLVTAYAKKGDTAMAEKWMLTMTEAGHAPNRVTYLAVMQAHSRAGRPRDVERFLSEMMRRRVQPDERCLTALVLANEHAPPGERMEADQVNVLFHRLVERGFQVAPSTSAPPAERLGVNRKASSTSSAADGRVSSRRVPRQRTSHSGKKSRGRRLIPMRGVVPRTMDVLVLCD